MTIKDFYEWAKARKLEDFEIQIQWRDGGGYYDGADDLKPEDIEIEVDGPKKRVIL